MRESYQCSSWIGSAPSGALPIRVCSRFGPLPDSVPFPIRVCPHVDSEISAAPRARLNDMSGRPTRFEHFRYLGDKRTQIVYDLDDAATPKNVIDDIVETGQGATFGPDSLAEARNRNYKAFKPKR